MNPDIQKIETLIAMGERLTAAIEADIAALKAGRPKEMASLDPDIQLLTLNYGREAATLDLERSKKAPADLRKKLVATTGKFRDALKLQNRLLTRMRNATEGLIKAVAEEVERGRNRQAPYAPQNVRPRANPGAMIFNSVV